MTSARSRCPTCGSPVVVAAGDEGTNHYVPANHREHTEAVLERDQLREAARKLVTLYMEDCDLDSAINELEAAAGLKQQGGS